MKLKFVLAATVAVAAVVTLAACDSGQAPAPAAPAATAPATPPPPPPPPAPPAGLPPGMAAPFASEADWIAACKDTGKLPESVCTCVGKAAVKEIGVQGLYTWVYEGYVNRDGMARIRSNTWFEKQGFDKAKQQKFADAVGKCYVTGK